MKRDKSNRTKTSVIALIFSLMGCNYTDHADDGKKDALTIDCTQGCDQNNTSAETSDFKNLNFEDENVSVTTIDNGSGYYAYGDTKVFAAFPDKNVVIGIQLTSNSAAIELSGMIYIFHDVVNQEQISQWIKNQRNGTVAQTSVPEPIATYSIPEESISVTSVSLADHIIAASGDQYNQYNVTFFISDTVLNDTYLLNNFSADTTVFERTQDIAAIDHTITIQTVNAKGQPLAVDQLYWYYVGNNEDLFESTWSALACQFSDCDQWAVNVNVPGIIHIGSSKTLASEDSGCAGYISGDTDIKIEPAIEQIITLVVSTPGSACQ